LPGINALAGTAALKNLLYQSGVDRQKVLGQLPSILSDIAKQKADAGYRQATLAQGQQRIDLSAKNEKRQLANDAFGQWAKTVSLKQGNQRLSMQSAQQQFNQWAKQQDLNVKWANVDTSRKTLLLSQQKASAKRPPQRFTPEQTQAYKATAAHMAKATFWGIKDKNGVNHPPLNYQDAISELQGEGVPLAIAQQALNRYWKRPGYEVDVQSRIDAKGDFGKVVWDRATAGRGRPLKSYQQRNPGKAGAAAETAALDTTQQTALAGQALSMIDPKLVTPDNVRALVSRIQQESGGNPVAVNNWDSNAKAGHPSKGILQTIDSTFNAYAVPGHDDIWNPLDNALAAVRYMLSRYGHIVAANGKGY
jgi:hypothetical protein